MKLLAEIWPKQVRRDHDRRLAQCPLLEIGKVDLGEVVVAPAGVEAAGVDPEGLAFITAGARQRRMQREAVILPPARAVIEPAEDIGVEDRAIGIDHRFLGGNVVAYGDLHPPFLRDAGEVHRGIVDVFGAGDGDRLKQLLKRFAALRCPQFDNIRSHPQPCSSLCFLIRKTTATFPIVLIIYVGERRTARG